LLSQAREKLDFAHFRIRPSLFVVAGGIISIVFENEDYQHCSTTCC
jgi:hypothetical protein